MPDTVEGRVIQAGKEGVFGVPATNTLRNVLDIPSHYPYSPERFRIDVDGSRVFPEYNAVSQYNHAGPNHELIPAQGETVSMRTAERTRYAVGFEQIYSMAWGLSRSLESGDRVRVGVFDENDGWFIEHRGDHDNDQVDLVVRSGTDGDRSRTNVRMEQVVETFARYELRTGWYRVTRQTWRQSIVAGVSQQNNEIGRTYREDGPEVGNLPLRFEVTRGASSSALTLEAGSLALITQGDRTDILRTGKHEVTVSTPGTITEPNWYPVYAARIDPSRIIVNTQLLGMNVVNYGGTGAIRVMLRGHDPSNVLKSGPTTLADSDFSTPPEHLAQNSVYEETDGTTVTQAADNTGTTVTETTDPGGRQIIYASFHSGGNNSKTITRSAENIEEKNGIYDGEYVVMWIRPDSGDTGVDLEMNVKTEQDW